MAVHVMHIHVCLSDKQHNMALKRCICFQLQCVLFGEILFCHLDRPVSFCPHNTCITTFPAHLDYIVPFPLHYPLPRWSYKHQRTVLHWECNAIYWTAHGENARSLLLTIMCLPAKTKSISLRRRITINTHYYNNTIAEKHSTIMKKKVHQCSCDFKFLIIYVCFSREWLQYWYTSWYKSMYYTILPTYASFCNGMKNIPH